MTCFTRSTSATFGFKANLEVPPQVRAQSFKAGFGETVHEFLRHNFIMKLLKEMQHITHEAGGRPFLL